MVDDLEGVGWLVLVEHGLRHPRARWLLENAMKDEISRWLRGVTACRRERRLTTQVGLSALDGQMAVQLSPFDAVASRLLFEAIGRELPEAHRRVVEEVVRNGHSKIAGATLQLLGLDSNQVHNVKEAVRRWLLAWAAGTQRGRKSSSSWFTTERARALNRRTWADPSVRRRRTEKSKQRPRDGSGRFLAQLRTEGAERRERNRQPFAQEAP